MAYAASGQATSDGASSLLQEFLSETTYQTPPSPAQTGRPSGSPRRASRRDSRNWRSAAPEAVCRVAQLSPRLQSSGSGLAELARFSHLYHELIRKPTARRRGSSARAPEGPVARRPPARVVPPPRSSASPRNRRVPPGPAHARTTTRRRPSAGSSSHAGAALARGCRCPSASSASSRSRPTNRWRAQEVPVATAGEGWPVNIVVGGRRRHVARRRRRGRLGARSRTRVTSPLSMTLAARPNRLPTGQDAVRGRWNA